MPARSVRGDAADSGNNGLRDQPGWQSVNIPDDIRQIAGCYDDSSLVVVTLTCFSSLRGRGGRWTAKVENDDRVDRRCWVSGRRTVTGINRRIFTRSEVQAA